MSGPIRGTFVGLPELDKLNGNELCSVHGVRGVPVNSPCLYSPVSMLIYEREAFHHNAANGSFHGSQNQAGDGDCTGYHVRENNWRHPPRTWLNPDELVPQ